LSHFIKTHVIITPPPLSLPSGLFPAQFPTEKNINYHICSTHATFPVDLLSLL
jgi:hypothetical protein